MDLDVYETILSYLVESDFDGEFVPNFYNEPLIFREFEDYISRASIALPKANIVLNTNGDLLSIERYENLRAAGVGFFLISQHDPNPSEPIKRIVDYAATHNHKNVIVTDWTKKWRVLSTRGGLVTDSRVQNVPEYGCRRALNMQIDFEGNVLVCCEDFLSENQYGNVISQSLRTIWNDSAKQRKEIFLGNYERDICKICAGQMKLEKSVGS